MEEGLHVLNPYEFVQESPVYVPYPAQSCISPVLSAMSVTSTPTGARDALESLEIGV